MVYKGKTLNLVPVNNSDLKVHDNNSNWDDNALCYWSDDVCYLTHVTC